MVACQAGAPSRLPAHRFRPSALDRGRRQVSAADSAIFADLFGTKAMRELFSDRRRLQSMLDVEAALARSQARLGIIPEAAAQAITAAATIDRLKLAEIAASTIVVGYPVVALVKALRPAAGTEAGSHAPPSS